jgi:hypothetical protein
MLTDEQLKMAARRLCEEHHLDPEGYHPCELDGPGMRTYEEVFADEIKRHELFHEVMGLAIENAKPPLKPESPNIEQEQTTDDALFPHEPEAILATVRESIVKYPITVQMLIEGIKYMAKLSDMGIRLNHIKRAMRGVAIKDSIPIPDDPDGHHLVKVLLDSGGG